MALVSLNADELLIWPPRKNVAQPRRDSTAGGDTPRRSVVTIDPLGSIGGPLGTQSAARSTTRERRPGKPRT